MADQSVIKKLALGTVQFGLNYGISNHEGQTPEKEVKEILNLAHQTGIKTLDTAWAYGSSEQVLGKTLPSDHTFEIVSKFPTIDPGKSISDYLQESLERLGAKSFYGYLAHTADLLKQNNALWSELQRLKAERLVSKIGYSLYSPSELQYLLSMKMIPDLIQIPYNIFDRRFEPHFEMLRDSGIEIHTRSAFLQGLFFTDPEKLPAFFDSVKSQLKLVKEEFSSVADLSASLLYFCASHPAVSRVVVGVNTADQLSDNLNGLKTVKIKEWPLFSIKDESILLPYHWPKKN